MQDDLVDFRKPFKAFEFELILFVVLFDTTLATKSTNFMNPITLSTTIQVVQTSATTKGSDESRLSEYAVYPQGFRVEYQGQT